MWLAQLEGRLKGGKSENGYIIIQYVDIGQLEGADAFLGECDENMLSHLNWQSGRYWGNSKHQQRFHAIQYECIAYLGQ